ncbi:MAG: carbohydrate kinase family protein [Candidatus Aenigmatarchaeota archaeon]
MKVLGFGDILVEKVITIDRFPKRTEKAEIKSFLEYASGKCANVTAALSKLEFDASFIGKVGSDAEGSLLIENMIHYGIDTKNIILGNENSGIRVIVKSDDNKEIILENMGANYNLKLEEINRIEKVDLAYFVLLKNESLKTQKCIAKILKKDGAKIIINTESLEKDKEGVLNFADVVFLDYNKFSSFSLNEIENKIKDFLKDVKIFVIKIRNGINGCIVFENGNKIEKHVFKNKDKVAFNEFNASSAFDAGFIFGLAKNKSLEDCVKLANFFLKECSNKEDFLSGIPTLHRLNFLFT